MINVCVLLKVVPTKATAILSEIQQLENMRKTYFTYGRFDIIAFLEVEDYKTLKKITGQINVIDGVRSTETLVES